MFQPGQNGRQTQPTFVHMPGSWFEKCPVRKILKKWGWQEKNWDSLWNDWQGNVYVGSAELFWTLDASLLGQYYFPNIKISNHFPGAERLCNKLFLGWCLQDQCAACAARFFPRQHSLCLSDSFPAFCADFEASKSARCPNPHQGNGHAWNNGVAKSSPPQPMLDGPAGAWVVKGISGGWWGNNGLAVNIYTDFQDIVAECEQYNWEAVVQKYIERPLLVSWDLWGPAIHKIDLRLWVLVLDNNPLIVLVHPGVYFRVAVRPYTFNGKEKPHPYAHKSNCRDQENRIDLEGLFERCGPQSRAIWENRTWPMLVDGARAAVAAAQDMALGPSLDGQSAPPNPKLFELVGFDFALDDEWRPWLLEVNRSPAMLDDCNLPRLLEWVEDATETMLATIFAYHQGHLQFPSVEQMEAIQCPAASRAERLFPPHGNCCRPDCFTKAVTSVPPCLVSGLSLGAPCGSWLLALYKPLEDEWTRKQRSTKVRDKWQSIVRAGWGRTASW